MSLSQQSRIRAAAFAACGLACATGAVFAASASDQPTAILPAYADAAPASSAPAAPVAPADDSEKPLMGFLTQIGIGKPLQDARINIYGWVEGSYEYNFNAGSEHLPGPVNRNFDRTFDFFQVNKGQLNQIDLTLERTVDLTTHQFDIGGRVDLMYGSDARFTTTYDFLQNQRGEYQFDLPNAYVDIAVPLGNGVRVRVGRVAFFKSVDPNQNPLYTHTIAYDKALPFTLTGVSAYYPITPDLSVEAGFSRGWNLAMNDNNGGVDGFGRIVWQASESAKFKLGVITGPEQFHDNSDYYTVVDLTYAQDITEHLALFFDAVYGDRTHSNGSLPGSFEGPTFNGTTFTAPKDEQYYGISGTAIYELCDAASLVGRLEWFDDASGLDQRFDGINTSFYSATLGLRITPFPNSALGKNFIVRPEIRYDYASKPTFSGLMRYDQTTVAVDAIFNF